MSTTVLNFENTESSMHMNLSHQGKIDASFDDLVKIFSDPTVMVNDQQSNTRGLPDDSFTAWFIIANCTEREGDEVVPVPIIICDAGEDQPDTARYAEYYHWQIFGNSPDVMSALEMIFTTAEGQAEAEYQARTSRQNY